MQADLGRFKTTPRVIEGCYPDEISLSPDGAHAALNCTDQGVVVVDRGSPAHNLFDSVNSCHLGAGNDRLCAGRVPIEVRGRSGEHLATLPPGKVSTIFSPDGSRLAEAHGDSVVVTDSITGDDLWWKMAPAGATLYATSGDGRTLYVPWDGKTEVRSVPAFEAVGFDGRRIAVLDGAKIHVRAFGLLSK